MSADTVVLPGERYLTVVVDVPGATIRGLETTAGFGEQLLEAADSLSPLTVTASITNRAYRFTVDAPLAIGGDELVFDLEGSLLTLKGGLSGNGVLTKRGRGHLLLTAASSYAGTTTIATGTVAIEHPAALGARSAGTVVKAGATLDTTRHRDGAQPLTEPLTLAGSGVDGLLGALVVQTAPVIAPITLTERTRIDTWGDAVLAGPISGPGELVVASRILGETSITLAGENSYSGGTEVRRTVIVRSDPNPRVDGGGAVRKQ